ncbi:MAG TPA: glycosyltransferase family 88 protein [Legionellaceae bacterium]|nr:glycosyltransferase family 88 protein [Legionellaceae bacterium]
MGISQEQFNELVYFALQVFIGEIKDLTFVNTHWRDPSGASAYGPTKKINAQSDLCAHFARQLFAARFHTLSKPSTTEYIQYRTHRYGQYINRLWKNIKELSANPPDLQTALLDYMSVFAKTSEDLVAEEDRVPYDILNLINDIQFFSRSSLSEAEYWKTFSSFKTYMINALNQYFHCNYDYTYINNQRPWLIQHFFSVYGPELFTTTIMTLAAYCLNPLPLCARLAIFEIPAMMTAINTTSLAVFQYLQHSQQSQTPEYLFNPHRHVKIWLSKNRNNFLPKINRLRFIRMRIANPGAPIFFVYSKALLNEKIISGELLPFCKKLNIIPICLEDDVFPHCVSEKEKKLIDLLQTEIKNLNNGGNLAAASDILRWLKPIYSLGTYSDFDAQINTHALPPHKVVQCPLLMRLGSIVVNSNTKTESLLLNNDTISVVDLDAAISQIEAIQNEIIEAYEDRNRYQHAWEQFLAQKKEYQLSQEQPSVASKLSVDELILPILAYIETQYPNKYPSEIRALALKLLDSNDSFLKLLCQMTHDESPEAVTNKKNALLSVDNRTNTENSEQILTDIRKKFQEGCLKISVMYTSGPTRLINIFGKHPIMNTDEMAHIERYSYEYYGLAQHFYSANSIPLHTNSEKLDALQHMSVGEINDAAWLPAGEKIMQSNAKTITRSVRVINNFFKNKKMKDSMKSVNSEEKPRPSSKPE